MIIGIDGNEANITHRLGVNQYAAELLKALEKLAPRREHEWVIYLSQPPLPHLPHERKGWKYVVLHGEGLWVLRKLTPYLWRNKDKINVLFTPSHYTPPFLPKPIVMSIMDLNYLKYPQFLTKKDLLQLKIWTQTSLTNAARVIAISESTKNEIIKNYPRIKKKISVTPLGYDKNQFFYPYPKTKIEKIKKKYGIKDNYLLYLGALKPNKNVEGLVEAISLVKGKVPDITLVIAGKKGWLYEPIFKKVSELALKESVIFTDYIPEEEKAALYAGARALVSPSFWEGFGMHVLEGMGTGCPVVISKAGSLEEVGGTAAIYVDPQKPMRIAEGILSVVEAPPSRYNKLKKKVLNQARKFSWEKTARETLKTLEEAVGTKDQEKC